MAVGRRLRGEGPCPNGYMIIREHPGKDEARTGRPFSGKTGGELQRFLDGVRLPAFQEWYLTSWIKEWCGPDADYTQANYDSDLPELKTELAAVRPVLILTLGREVTRFFLGDVDMETVHGIPWQLPLDSAARQLFDLPEAVVIFPAYNPAAGFRNPELSAQCAYDFAQLEGVIAGTIDPRILFDDPIPNPCYEEITDEAILDAAMVDAVDIATDSEGYPWAPWSVQITTREGHAYVIRYLANKPGGGPLMQKFAEWVNSGRSLYHFTFHSALHDLAVFRAVGIDTRELAFDDTMIMAYNLQLEPQGLKPLGARFCNMRMEHFTDVMGDAGFQIAQDWLLMVLENEDHDHARRCEEEFVRLTTTAYTNAKGKVVPGRRLKKPPQLPKRDLHKAVERCLRSKDPRKLWGDQVLDRHVDAYPAYGPMWHATLDHVPRERAIRYAGRDSDCTHRLRPRLLEKLRANELEPVYRADLATVPLIDRMQQIGVRPDLDHFARLSVDLGGEIESILARIRQRIGDAATRAGDSAGSDFAVSFNPNSTYHVGELLYEKFNLDVLKRTPGGDPSTNDKILEALEKDVALDRPIRDLIADIREYREVYKLKHTFCDRIPDFVNRWPFDGRIHSTFRITRVVTGRLAASDPNLLALPKHGKFAKRFREGFVAGDGALITSFDLSQIELRVLAHLSQDPVLLNAFRTGVDLHATLAQRIFGVDPKNQDESKHRLPAKAVNFGIPMGMTNVGLCIELRKNGVDIDEDDAQRWLIDTMQLYRDVPVYQQAKIAQARRYGFVTDLCGRRRYIGGIRSWDNAIRSEAERFAFSTPIQAGAQQVMHEAEAYVYSHILLPRWYRDERIEPLIQIHDDLLFETSVYGKYDIRPHPNAAKAAKGKKIIVVEDGSLYREIVHAMTQVPAHWLSVPIETSGDAGESWGRMHEIVIAP